MQLKEVTNKEFYAVVGQLDVHPRIVGEYPYTSEFRDKSGTEHGRIVNCHPGGFKGLVETKYYVVVKEEN